MVKITILPKALNRFNEILIKITSAFSKEIEQKVIRLVWKHKRPQISKTILRKKNESRGITLPNFKLYYKVTVIRTAWYWQQNRHTDQWSRIKSPEVNPHLYGQIIFNKQAISIQRRKESLFNKWCWENWKATYKRMKLDCLSPHAKINSKWIKDLNIQPESIKCIEENIGTKLKDLGLKEDFMNLTSKASRSKMNAWDYKVKRQPLELENVFGKQSLR
uniref:Uncharacterized protein n=1 Tax=Rousettus aegyptiacus TaxID=9407 RepID=A0A7J8F0E5_ROUAE|nr:hypothetical protein HJG63_012371 [Rousettus aegyptiacus]